MVISPLNSRTETKDNTVSAANQLSDYYDNIPLTETELSMEDAVSFAMQDYDDTLGYSYWRGNVLGFDQVDERNPSKMTFKTDVSGGTLGNQTIPAAKSEEVGAHPIIKQVEDVKQKIQTQRHLHPRACIGRECTT
eukprot:633294_1